MALENGLPYAKLAHCLPALLVKEQAYPTHHTALTCVHMTRAVQMVSLQLAT